MIKKLFILFFLLSVFPAFSADNDENRSLGESLDDCLEGCDCITDYSRWRDKSGVVIEEVEEEVESDSGSSRTIAR